MSFREGVEAENEMDDGYFEIIHNFRKVEKTKRRKLLKLYKLRVAGERKKEILKASQRRAESRLDSCPKSVDESDIWDVLNDDCLDFKLSEDFLFKD